MASSHAVIKLSVRARIGEWDFHDVVQFVSTFAINSIPQAAITVAVGSRVDTQEVATIHRAINDLKVQQVAKVYLTAQIFDVASATPGVPAKEILIFEGKTVGTGWRRSEGTAHFTIHLLHWLGDINYASAINAAMHPGSPADWSYPAVFKAMKFSPGGANAVNAGGSGNVQGDASWVPMINDQAVNVAALADIWGNILHRWMTTISESTFLDPRLGGGNQGAGDQNTLDALARMGPNTEGQTLNLKLADADALVVSENIRQALLHDSGSSWVNTTLWGKLIGDWAPAYMFSVIPRIEDALIVPFAGGLRGAPWAVIGDEDYSQADINGQQSQVLRAVGITHPIMSPTGADANLAQISVNHGGLAGFYQPLGLEQGMVLMKDAPKWLMDPLLPYLHSLVATAVNTSDVTGTVMDEANTGKPRTPARDLEQSQRSFKSIMVAYAHQWYALESLKGRVGEVAGKLRFDIAPGSNVLVRAGGARNLTAADDALKEDIFATVVQVSYVINAEAQKAGTAFALAHIRTEAENNDEATSVDSPPLYEKGWPGAVLCKDVQAEVQ